MSEESTFQTELYSIGRLLSEVRGGRVRVPFFQRGFVWNDNDRLQLFDSIAKGYPIGTLLLAKGKAPAGVLRLGNYERTVDEQTEALWVIDGQQRLSTISMSLLGDFTGAYRPIYFDLAGNRFVLGPRKRAPSPAWVPASLLGSAKTLNRWLRERNLGDDLCDRADAVAAKLREYTVPAYVVPYHGDDKVPREIFARINRRGRALTRQEVFNALHADAAGMKPFERVSASLARLGFGELGAPLIERTTVAILGRAPGALPEMLPEAFRTPEKERELFDRVEDALARAIQFLTGEADVPHISWLPYDGALPTLALFFSKHEEPHERNLELLGRWFWRGTVAGRLATDNAEDGERWKVILREDQHQAVQGLLRLLPATPDVREWTLRGFRRGTARTHIELLALYSLGPRVLTGEERGAEVQIPEFIEEETEPSRARMPWLLGDEVGAEKTIAYALIHPRVKTDQFELSEWMPTLCETHAIDESAWTALCSGNFSEFARIRERRVESVVRGFLTRHLGLDVADRDHPPLDTFLEGLTS